MFCEQIKWIRNLEGSPVATASSTIIFLCNNRIRCTLLSHFMSYVVPLPRENTRCELKRNTFFNRIHCSNYNLLYNCIYHSLTPPVLSLTLFIPTPLLCFFRHKLRLQISVLCRKITSAINCCTLFVLRELLTTVVVGGVLVGAPFQPQILLLLD